MLSRVHHHENTSRTQQDRTIFPLEWLTFITLTITSISEDQTLLMQHGNQKKKLSFLGSFINSLTDYNLFRKQTDRIFKTAFKIFFEIKIIFKIYILRKTYQINIKLLSRVRCQKPERQGGRRVPHAPLPHVACGGRSGRWMAHRQSAMLDQPLEDSLLCIYFSCQLSGMKSCPVVLCTALSVLSKSEAIHTVQQ